MRPNASGDISVPAGQNSALGVVWRKPRQLQLTPDAIVYGDYLLCNDNGVLTVYDAKSGTQVYVHRIGTTNSTFSASPIAGRGQLYFASEDGEVSSSKPAGLRAAGDQPDGRAIDGDPGRL